MIRGSHKTPVVRIPEVGEQGWSCSLGKVEILAVADDAVWVRAVSEDAITNYPYTAKIRHLIPPPPPEPFVTHHRYIGVGAENHVIMSINLLPETQAAVERLSDGTWQIKARGDR